VLKTILSLPSRNKENLENFPGHSKAPEDEMVKDPCCDTYISKKGAISARINGETFYFCSKECLERYKEDRLLNYPGKKSSGS
jgi:YHS domain-containing protein